MRVVNTSIVEHVTTCVNSVTLSRRSEGRGREGEGALCMTLNSGIMLDEAKSLLQERIDPRWTAMTAYKGNAYTVHVDNTDLTIYM